LGLKRFPFLAPTGSAALGSTAITVAVYGVSVLGVVVGAYVSGVSGLQINTQTSRRGSIGHRGKWRADPWCPGASMAPLEERIVAFLEIPEPPDAGINML
jgi:hypothetical protein